jgi:iron complex transport system substrate-binding protein
MADLAREPGPPIPVIAWDRTGFSAGEGTLYDAILSSAGARNLIRAPATLSYRKPDIELLLQADPVLLVQGSMDQRSPSVSDDAVRHRLVKRFWGDRTLIIPQAYYVCGTPMLGDAAVRLRSDLRKAAASRPRPPILVSELPS